MRIQLSRNKKGRGRGWLKWENKTAVEYKVHPTCERTMLCAPMFSLGEKKNNNTWIYLLGRFHSMSFHSGAQSLHCNTEYTMLHYWVITFKAVTPTFATSYITLHDTCGTVLGTAAEVQARRHIQCWESFLKVRDSSQIRSKMGCFATLWLHRHW